MTQETLTAAKKALENSSIYSLFSDAIAVPEDINEDSSDIGYALMFNTESNELFFLEYATSENSWAKTAEQQNPWIHLGYVSAVDILMNDPASEISDRLDYEFGEQQQMDEEYKKYNS